MRKVAILFLLAASALMAFIYLNGAPPEQATTLAAQEIIEQAVAAPSPPQAAEAAPSQNLSLERRTLEIAVPTDSSEKTEPRGVEVTVMLEDDTPVAGASVYFFDSKTAFFENPATANLSIEPSPLEVARLVSQQYLTNSEGVVLLPPLVKYSDIVATYGKLYDSYFYRDESRVRLYLAEGRAIEVCTLTSAGSPAANIDIGFSASYSDSDAGDFDWPDLSVRTTASGCANLKQIEIFLSPWAKSASVGVLGLFPTPIFQRIDPQKLPEEPITLRLPPYASVSLRLVDADSYPSTEQRYCNLVIDPNPVQGRSLEQLRHDFERASSMELQQRLYQDETTFTCVGLNQSFIAEIRDVDPLHSTLVAFQGPTQVGEHLQVEIRPVLEERQIHLPLLGPEGLPLKSTTVNLELHQIWQENLGSYFSDRQFRSETNSLGEVDLTAHGDFFLLSPKLNAITVRIAAIRSPVRTSLFGFAEIHPAQIQNTGELAPIQLHSQGVLVAGKIVGVPAEKIDSIELTVQHCPDPALKDAQGWQDLDDCFIALDGSFASPMPSTPPIGLLRLAVSSDSGAMRNYSFQLGARDVILNLDGEALLNGSILLPEGPEEFSVVTAFTPQARANTTWKMNYGHIEPDGRFEIKGLPSTPGSLVVWGRPGDLPLLSIEDVLPHSPHAPGDPRLNPIDLRQAVKFFEVSVTNESGEIIPRGYFRGVGLDDGLWANFHSSKTLVIPSVRNSMDALCWAAGYTAQTVQLHPGPNHVTLERGLEVQAKVTGFEALPDDLRVVLGMRPTKLELRSFSGDGARVSATGTATLYLPSAGSYIYSVKVYRGEQYVTGYRMNDAEDLVNVMDSDEPQNIVLRLPLEEILADLE